MDFSPVPKRILFLDHAPILGGAEIALLNLIDGLDRQRFTPLVATAPGSPLMAKLARAGIRSVIVPFGRLNGAGAMTPINLFRSTLTVASTIREHKVALLHTNTVRTHIIGSLAAALTGTRVIWTIHDNTFPLPLVRLLAPIPVRVVAVSNWLCNFYELAGLAHKIVVIPNGINSTEVEVSDGSLRQELHIPVDVPLVVDVGRLVAGKAPHLFIQAAQISARTFPDARFILVGGPDRLEPRQSAPNYLRELENVVRESSLGERLIMVGQRSDVGRFYAAADVIVYCAVALEGLPTVVLETMSYAKPIVASAIGGAVELVQDGVSGVLVPPNNVAAMAAAIVHLLSNREYAHEMGLAGQARLKQAFDSHTQVTKIEQVYDQCLD